MKMTLVAFILLATASAAVGEVGPPADVASRARGAGRIVVARVLDVRAQFETNQFGDQLIVSHAVLDVLETLKGAPASTVQVTVEGGTIGDLTLKVSDLPSLMDGERAVFFLEAAAGGGNRPHGRGRGILKLDDTDRVQGSNVTLNDVKSQIRGALSQGGR